MIENLLDGRKMDKGTDKLETADSTIQLVVPKVCT